MSRRRKQTYRSSELADLTRQLLYSPPEKRADVVRRAEQLHDELDPAKNYPFDFVVYRLTQRRIPPRESVMFVGEAMKPDLRLLIDAVSQSIDLPCDKSDPGMTTAELARSLDVSTKTIARWRNSGLRWRWGMRAGKATVLITRSAVEAFKQSQSRRVDAAAAFRRLSDSEKHRLIERAARLAEATDALPHTILTHLSKRSGRSIETLRQLVKQHDTANPKQAVFGDRAGPLTDDQKRAIDAAYQRGETVSALCHRFSKTRSTIYRAIHEGRAKRVAKMQITAVHSPIFERSDADEVLTQPVTTQAQTRQLGQAALDSLPPLLRPIYDRPIQPDPVVRSLIVRYNFLKHRAKTLQSEIALALPRANVLDQFDELLTRIADARGAVIAAVLPIALSVVLRQQMGAPSREDASLIVMLEAAHRVLLEEIDRYDATVAHTFESVLTNRLLRVLARPAKTRDTTNEHTLIEQLTAAGFQKA